MSEHNLTFELYYDGSWRRADVRTSDGASIMRGIRKPGDSLNPGNAGLTLDNPLGLYAPRSLASALRGKIGQNTPGRVSLDGSVRLTGEMASWQPQRPVKGSGYTPVQLAGILRRIGRATDAFQSPVRRSYDHRTVAPVAYWPLVEIKGSTVAYDVVTGAPSTVGGFTPLTVGNAGAPQFGIVDAGVGSEPIANLGGGWTLNLKLPPVAATGTVAYEFTTAFGTNVRNVGVTTYAMRLDPSVRARHLSWQIGVFDDGTINLRWLEADANLALLAGPTEVYNSGAGLNIFDGRPRTFYLELAASGGTNVAWSLRMNGSPLSSGTVTPSFSGAMTAPPWRASAISTIGADDLAGWGHVAVWTASALQYVPTDAWVGETAGDRFLRLCAEQGIDAVVYSADLSQTTLMGPQGTDPFLDQLGEIADTDDALIYEDRLSTTLYMLPGFERMNRAVALSVSYLGQIKPPLLPVFGDEGLRNDVTARDPSGNTRRVQQLTGPNNVQLPSIDPKGAGRYPGTLDANTKTTDGLTDAAAWRVWLGTYDGTRYASVEVDLDAAPGLKGAVNTLDIGDLVLITDLPPEDGAGDFLGQIIGIEDKAPAKRRTVVLYLAPADPYRVGKLAATTGDTDPLVGYLDPDGSTTAAGIAAGAATFSVTTASGPLWSTVADDFPLDVVVGGQRVSISSISGASSPQTFTVQVGGRQFRYAVASGAEVLPYQPIVLTP